MIGHDEDCYRPELPAEKICERCHRAFKPKHPWQHYCRKRDCAKIADETAAEMEQVKNAQRLRLAAPVRTLKPEVTPEGSSDPSASPRGTQRDSGPVGVASRLANDDASVDPGPGEIVGPETEKHNSWPVWREITVPPAAPHGYDNTYVYADGIAHAINKSTVWLRHRGCPHCDDTGTCPRGFPLPIRCSLCHGDAVDCCTQLTEDKQHDRY